MSDKEGHFFVGSFVQNYETYFNTLTSQYAPHLIAGIDFNSLRAKSADGKLTIVDAASGTGAVAVELAKLFPHDRIIATDMSQEMLNLLKFKIESQGLKNIEVVVADLCVRFGSSPHFVDCRVLPDHFPCPKTPLEDFDRSYRQFWVPQTDSFRICRITAVLPLLPLMLCSSHLACFLSTIPRDPKLGGSWPKSFGKILVCFAEWKICLLLCREMARILKPGGMMALTCWKKVATVEWLIQSTLAVFPDFDLDQGTLKLAYRLADDSVVRKVCRVCKIQFRRSFASFPTSFR